MEVQVPREDRMSVAADVNGGTSAAGGMDAGSGQRSNLVIRESMSY
jgi:hypothetical protein